MTEAIFGLLGVLVGGALTGFKDVLIERRREERMTRGAIRVLLTELADMSAVASGVREAGTWKAPEPRPLPAATWREHAAALADIEDSVWNAVELAVAYAEFIEISIRTAPHAQLREQEQAIVDKAVDQFAAAAYALIAYRAAHPKVGAVRPRPPLARRLRAAVRSPFWRVRYRIRLRRHRAARKARSLADTALPERLVGSSPSTAGAAPAER